MNAIARSNTCAHNDSGRIPVLLSRGTTTTQTRRPTVPGTPLGVGDQVDKRVYGTIRRRHNPQHGDQILIQPSRITKGHEVLQHKVRQGAE